MKNRSPVRKSATPNLLEGKDMAVDLEKPSLRTNLDIVPLEHENERLFAIRDPLGLAGDPIVVPGPLLYIISLMDGASTILDIQLGFTKQFGELVMGDRIREIAADLDERGYLEGPGFDKKLRAAQDEYRCSLTRTASHAGQAYPDEPDELKAFLEEVVPARPAGKEPPPRGLVAPHIDIERGRSIYTAAYTALAGKRPPRRVVIFGTGHFADGHLYILSPKDHFTPLGPAEADKEFCDKLVEACPFDLTLGELGHRIEHSIEFQVLFLQHLFGGDAMPRIVPVLCTSLESRLQPGASPAEHPEVEGFLRSLDEAVGSGESGDTLLLAAADMCHVGPKFGASEPLTQSALDQVRHDDDRVLQAAVSGGAEAFYGEVAAIGNRNHICSVASIYTVFKFLDGIESELLGYDMAAEPDGSAAVGFGALRIG